MSKSASSFRLPIAAWFAVLAFVLQLAPVQSALPASDTVKPTVTVGSPRAGQRLGGIPFVVSGTARDNVEVAEVRFQLNTDDEWTAASTENGWTNWTATIRPAIGANTIRVQALDVSDNESPILSVRFIYAPTAPMQVQIDGGGTVSPNYNNQPLEIGKQYTMTASAGPGFLFTDWTGDINPLTPSFTFVMGQGSSFTAHFLDVRSPTVAIKSPTLSQRWSNEVFTATGTAADNGQLARVRYQLNDSAWQSAMGTTNWEASFPLVPGSNTIRVYAFDTFGLASTTNSAEVFYVPTEPLILEVRGKGTFTPNYTNGSRLEAGKSYTITARPASGFLFAGWSGSIETNSPSISFVMEASFSLQANFQDVIKPTVTVTAPTMNQKVSVPEFTIRGTTVDNGFVSQVSYQLNGGPWLAASGTTSWQAPVELMIGTNQVRVYAVDQDGNSSTTNSLNVVYTPIPFPESSTGFYTGSYSKSAAGLTESGKLFVTVARDGTLFAATAAGVQGTSGRGTLTGANRFSATVGSDSFTGTLNPSSRQITGTVSGQSVGVFSLARTTAFTFRVTPIQGTYAGPATGQWGAEATHTGSAAALVRADGSMVLVGFPSTRIGGVALNGFTTTNGMIEISRASGGQLRAVASDKVLAGNYEAALTHMGQDFVATGGGTLNLTRLADTGAQRTNAGYYTGTFQGTSNGASESGQVNAILAANGQLYLAARDAAGLGRFGFTGTISSANALTTTTNGVRATGTLVPSSHQITGSYSGSGRSGSFLLRLSTSIASIASVAGRESEVVDLSSAETPIVIVPHQVELLREAGGLRMNFPTTTGTDYQIQSSRDLIEWTEVSRFTAIGSSATILLPPTSGTTQEFFRVVPAR